MAWVLYIHTVDLLTSNLKERLLAIVRTGAEQFHVDDLAALQVEKDWHKPQWATVVNELKAIRLANDNVLFAYIFRHASDGSNKLEFVSDSHSIDPYAKIDLNGDGKIDDADQLQWPGQPYDEPPAEASLGFDHPLTNAELYQDQWGTEITGYAPIRGRNGKAVAVLAVDMKAGDFLTITRQTLYPFLAFIAALIFVLLALAVILVAVWERQLRLLALIDREKDELIGIVSHQLASPISSLQWSLEDVLDGDFGAISGELQNHLRDDQKTIRTLLDLTSLLLDVSRIELGRLKMRKESYNLTEFFREILNTIEPKARAKSIHFKVSVAPSLGDGIFDRRLARMTIENLLTNAVKYTPSGGAVEFAVAKRGNLVTCEVADTGIGIPKKDQSKVFGKLYRASNVGREDGNGFGLYVAKGAIEQQGGRIWFESQEGKGTTFFVELPV